LHWTLNVVTLQMLFMLKQQHYTLSKKKKKKKKLFNNNLQNIKKWPTRLEIALIQWIPLHRLIVGLSGFAHRDTSAVLIWAESFWVWLGSIFVALNACLISQYVFFYRICQLAAVSRPLFTTWAVHFHVISVVPLFASSSHGGCENEEVSHRSVSHFSVLLATGLNFLTALASSQQVFSQHTDTEFVCL